MKYYPKPSEGYQKESVLFYLGILTCFFFLSQVSFFIQCNRMYLDYFNFVSNHLSIPLTMLPDVLFFIFAQLLIHLMYCLLSYFISEKIAHLFSLRTHKKIILSMAIWLIGILTILSANQYYFPNSKFSALTSLVLFNESITAIVFFTLLFFCVVFLFLTVLAFLLPAYIATSSGAFQRRKVCMTLMLLFTVGCLTIFTLCLFLKPSMVHDGGTTMRPNIVIIGMDALRPDFLSFFGREQATPHLDSFLSQASVFSEAVTPDARTFPSWTSILTGQYPRQNGIRFNLAMQNKVDLTDTLPAILQRAGYETIFATDETRFSNIGTNYGFKQLLTPPMGLNDFLLGTFNDFPLSNLLVNTVVGKWLFPYSYANRAAYITYEPQSFLHLIQPVLSTSRDSPLFLTAHFCLAHFPYVWASQPADQLSMQERYAKSVMRLDQQIGDFLVLLKKYHVLDHAIVVLLSDHGEALAFQGDRITEQELFKSRANIPQFYPPSLDNEAVNQSVGHGTDVLGLPQYHSLLAFKLYGLDEWQQPHVVPGVVSLLDIKPTILSLVHLAQKKHQTAGISLADIMLAKSRVPKMHIFLESDYSPNAIRTVYPETNKVLFEGIQVFQIDPVSLKLTVKDSMANMIIHSKQYADIYGEWMLAIYPQSKNHYMPILINLNTGEWTNDLQSVFAKKSPATAMLFELKTFFGNEIA